MNEKISKESSKKFTYLVDYDDMSLLITDDQKIEWMYKRIQKFLLEPIQKFIKKRDSALELGIVTLICCGIEAMGHFLKGRTGIGGGTTDFKLFIETYMPEFSPIQKKLYDHFRCGLAHAFAIERGSIEDKIKTLYEKEERNQSFYKVHPWKLFESLEEGFICYFKDLKSGKGREEFVDRFNYSFKFWINNPPNKNPRK